MAKRPRDEVEREIMDIIPERFDADSGSMGARRGAHTRLILTIALGLLALAAIGVAARHLLVGEGGQQVAVDATVPVIKADSKPIKTKPEDRGGMAVPNQDKLVYQDVGKGEAAAEPEKLLPPAEKPQVPAPKPGATAPAKDNAASASMPAPASASSDIPAAPPAVSQSATPTAPAPAATPAAPAPSSTTAASAATTPAQAGASAKKDSSTGPAATPAPTTDKPKTMAAATPAPAPATPAAKPAASAASTGGGGWQIQLAAMKSEAEAQVAWKKAVAANKDLLGSLTQDIVKADLGAKGIFYRLRAGPLDEAGAKNLCAELAKHNQGCIVARK